MFTLLTSRGNVPSSWRLGKEKILLVVQINSSHCRKNSDLLFSQEMFLPLHPNFPERSLGGAGGMRSDEG